jgi:carboxymethylenebutenolidase
VGEIVTERCTYQSEHGEVGGYLARPAEGGPWPAVVVIHDRYGLWEHIEEAAREFAEEGYLALAPDLNWRDEVRRSLADEDVHDGGKVVSQPEEYPLERFPEERQAGIARGAEWLRNRASGTHIGDTLAALSYLKARPDVRAESVGAFGFCMGGRVVASVTGVGADLAAAVIYYGIYTDPEQQAPNVRCPVHGHYGATDKGVTGTVPATEAAMKANGKDYTAFVYENAGHAFADRFSESSSRPEVARQAWERTLEFFARHLKRVPTAVS